MKLGYQAMETCLGIAATELWWLVQDKAILLEILVWVGLGQEF